jgi:hypothetical protein
VPPDTEPRRPREGAAPPDPLPGRLLRSSLLPSQSELRQCTKAEPAACLPAAGLHREREVMGKKGEEGHGKEDALLGLQMRCG